MGNDRDSDAIGGCAHGNNIGDRVRVQLCAANVVWPKYPNALLYHRLRLHHDARFSLNFITL